MSSINPTKSAYVAVDNRVCFNCGGKGYLSYNCPNPKSSCGTHGGRSGTRGGRWSRGGGRGRGRGSLSANVASTGEALSITLTVEQLKMWEQWQKGKASEASLDSATTTSHFGNFANYAHLGEGTQAHARASSYRQHIDWVIDSWTSKYVTGESHSFTTYIPCAHSETIQIVDGTSQPIYSVESVERTPSISLSFELHVPSFPVNLLSISSIIDHFTCIVIFDEHFCIFQEKTTRRMIGTGVRRNGLWYINHEESALNVAIEGAEKKIMLLHCRLAHISFETLSRLYPDVFKKVDKSRIVCDACELDKHTRSTYASIGLRSCEPFILIHSDVWGPCSVTSVSGVRWFAIFINCYTRMT
jgi:hypothetical protein